MACMESHFETTRGKHRAQANTTTVLANTREKHHIYTCTRGKHPLYNQMYLYMGKAPSLQTNDLYMGKAPSLQTNYLYKPKNPIQ